MEWRIVERNGIYYVQYLSTGCLPFFKPKWTFVEGEDLNYDLSGPPSQYPLPFKSKEKAEQYAKEKFDSKKYNVVK